MVSWQLLACMPPGCPNVEFYLTLPAVAEQVLFVIKSYSLNAVK